MAYPKKCSDEQLIASYKELGNVWRVAERHGMCGQSVHERLRKLGVELDMNRWADDDERRLLIEYPIYRNAGKLSEFAKLMGRTKQFLCRKAREAGLTDPKHPKPYAATWKYISEEAARVLLEEFRASSFGAGQFCARRGYDDLGFSRAMQRFFPDEWDLICEAKIPHQSMYRLGRAFEYRVRDDLRRRGYFVLRSPASKSPLDLVAIGRAIVIMIQCKRNGQLGPKEWNELLDIASPVAAVAVLACSPKGRGIDYLRLIGRKDGTVRRQPYASYEPPTTGEEAKAVEA